MTADRKQSAVARRVSKHIDNTTSQYQSTLDATLEQRITQAELGLNSVTNQEYYTTITANDANALANSVNATLTTQLDPTISGTLANLVQRASYYYLRYLTTIDLGTSGTGNGPLSNGMKLSLNIGTGYSYTKDQDLTVISEDVPEAFIRGKVASYDTTTGILSVYAEEVGKGSSNRWTVNVGAPTIQRYDLDGGFASTDINGGTAAAGGGFDIDGGVA